MQSNGLKIGKHKPMIRILIIMIVILGGACKAGKQNKPETARLELRKTPCFGRCPEFTFTVDLSGKATYSGFSNVEKIGEYEKTFPKEEVKKAVDAFEAAGYWNFNDKYVNPGVTDLPSVYTYFEHNGRSKRIEDQINSPKELKTLQKMLEAMSNTDGWTKTGDIRR